ncbi:F-box/LRR-repeat protein, partial [Trifolium medium]|nr:F-box/LRR-repeat protein [Trifolium medium]
MEELEEDRLSSLPKIILHDILSRLPKEDAARTSVLCKAWLDIWYTFPILSFCASEIIGLVRPKAVKMRNILGFCDFVKRRMLRFHDQSLAIKEFKLKVIEYSQYVSAGQDQYHVLPMCVIEAKSLTKLVLEG